MRLLFAGTPEPALPVLDALVESSHEVVAVLTRPDARRGRGRTLHPSPVSARAQELGIPVLTPRTLRDDAVVEEIRALNVDAAPVVAYGNLVPPSLLDVPKHGWLNLHFSLLPAWRGAAPVQHAIMAGDDVTGAAIFRLEEGLDTGPVFASFEEPIGATDTSGDLLERLGVRGAVLMVEVLDAIEAGTASATPQLEEGVSLAPKIEVAQGRVDFTAPRAVIDRIIRGVTPAPGAWTTDAAGARFKLGPVAIPDGDVPSLAPGELVAEKNRVLVGAGDGALVLGKVAPAGKSWMDAAAWARGARLEPGAKLGASAPETTDSKGERR